LKDGYRFVVSHLQMLFGDLPNLSSATFYEKDIARVLEVISKAAHE